MADSKKNTKILLADDDESLLFAMESILGEAGNYKIKSVVNGKSALEALLTNAFEVALLDLKLPDTDGLEILKKAKEAFVTTEIVMITGHASIDTAVSAIRLGAYDYLPKPVEGNEVLRVVERALERFALLRQNQQLQNQVDSLTRYHDLLGKSAPMQALFQTLEAVASSDASLLILGESGTGKELVAHAVHKGSERSSGPFIAVNCAALPATILESELFGHERGAFTGAVKDKKGLFAQAHGGTMFLDEIAEMPFELQAKLLRVLETGAFRPVGGQDELRVDVRVLAATNQKPQQAVQEKHLREDLYYRLAVVEVELPALRDRLEDINLLANYFLNRFAAASGKEINGFAPESLECLLNYEWPGNVRELRNAIERAVILNKSDAILPENLPPRILKKMPATSLSANTVMNGDVIVFPLGESLANIEQKFIIETLQNCENNKTKAAKVLGISLKTLHNKLGRYKESE
ncbi:MAG: sigma-54-dependent Fis family transcriptional regulator [Deferribacteres bacterium]|nr:sigma-54-dependent Fis family transcriptional regulator [candidate division KSB1 bacterium]MCB9500391.1 sigma-54-dependent Fis family transcriptional regulator [Deferribacteres bacterium]